MKKAIKYILTYCVLIGVTAAVMAFPSLYYSSSDKKHESTAVVSTLELSKSKRESLSCVDAYLLMCSPDSVDMTYYSNAIDSATASGIVKEGAEKMLENYNRSSRLYFIFDYYIFSNFDEMTFTYTSRGSIGTIEGEPASITVIDAVLDSPETDSSLYITVDYYTKKVYNFLVVGTVALSNLYAEHFSNALTDENKEQADISNDTETMSAYFAEYWSVPQSWVQIDDSAYNTISCDISIDELLASLEKDYDKDAAIKNIN